MFLHMPKFVHRIVYLSAELHFHVLSWLKIFDMHPIFERLLLVSLEKEMK